MHVNKIIKNNLNFYFYFHTFYISIICLIKDLMEVCVRESVYVCVSHGHTLELVQGSTWLCLLDEGLWSILLWVKANSPPPLYIFLLYPSVKSIRKLRAESTHAHILHPSFHLSLFSLCKSEVVIPVCVCVCVCVCKWVCVCKTIVK